MKKFLSAILFALTIVTVAPAQAHSDVGLNQNFNERLAPMSYIYGRRVVGISTYLSVRERPNVNSAEVLRFCDGIGYVSARYIRID